MKSRLRGLSMSMAAMALIAATLVAVGCGSPTAKSAATQSPMSGADTGGPGGTPGARMRNRTQSPEIQTSIAQGTPRAFGNRTPPPDVQTAVAQGTPASALRGGFGGGPGGGRVITALATVLAVDEGQLRSELQASGASIEKVAAGHGMDRPTLRQRLIDAVRQSLNDAVKNGMLTQDVADQNASQFEANVDNTLDRVGGGGALDRAGGGPQESPTPG